MRAIARYHSSWKSKYGDSSFSKAACKKIMSFSLVKDKPAFLPNFMPCQVSLYKP